MTTVECDIEGCNNRSSTGHCLKEEIHFITKKLSTGIHTLWCDKDERLGTIVKV